MRVKVCICVRVPEVEEVIEEKEEIKKKEEIEEKEERVRMKDWNIQ